MSRPLRPPLLNQLIQLRDPLRRLLGRRISMSDADDCLQDTAVRLLEGRSREDVAQPRAYLASAARRLAIDHYRKHQREVSMETVAEVFECEEAGSDPEQLLSDEQEKQRVHEALRKLRGPALQAMTLRYFHHMSYREIGESMRISPRTVEKHLAKGLAACRSYLQRNA